MIEPDTVEQPLKDSAEIVLDLRSPPLPAPSVPTTRTSFALSRKALDAMDYLKHYTSMSNKELFNFIVEYLKTEDWGKMFTDAIICSIEKLVSQDSADIMRKSYVIQEDTLKFLNEYAKKNNIKRDLVVSGLLVLTQIQLEEREQRQLESHKNIFQQYKQWLEEGERMFKSDTFRSLGLDNNDPMWDLVRNGLVGVKMCVAHAEYFLSKGVPVKDANHRGGPPYEEE
jgi:hypothetical protein